MTLKQAIVRKAEGLTRLRTKVISDRRRCRMGLKPRVALASPYSLCGTASDWLVAAASLVFEPLTAESPPLIYLDSSARHSSTKLLFRVGRIGQLSDSEF
jgi:hypothetical protein